MSYIGDKDGTPAPKLKDSINRIADIEKEMNISINFIKKLYKQAKLVHGDLSEYNKEDDKPAGNACHCYLK